MMGTVAVGARSAGARTVGVIPQFLIDWEVADPESDDLVTTDDMGARKAEMIEKSDGFLILPGGLGTLDELFEVWTTGYLGVHDKPVVLLNAGGFYTGLLAWLAEAAAAGYVVPRAFEALTVVETVAEALDALA
jgi:uncharacterized protein (TIGR00730 family)